MKVTTLLTLLSLACFLFTSFGDETATATTEEVVEESTNSGEETETSDPETISGIEEDVLDLDAESVDVEPEPAGEGEPVSASSDDDAASTNDEVASEQDSGTKEGEVEDAKEEQPPVQTGPFIDLFGESLLSLEMIDEKQAQLHSHYTNEALSGKKVVGIYFSADWCGPCRQFTPDLVNFYNKINSRRGKENEFEIVWVSRCRDFDSFGQYFTHMNWLALPPQEAMGERGQMLSDKYKVKGIPHFVLIDGDTGETITIDGRSKIPMDKAGIGFPWRNPIAQMYMTVVPRSLRLMIKTQITEVKEIILKALKGGTKPKTAKA